MLFCIFSLTFHKLVSLLYSLSTKSKKFKYVQSLSSLAPLIYAAGLVGSRHRNNVPRSRKISLLKESESSHQH